MQHLFSSAISTSARRAGAAVWAAALLCLPLLAALAPAGPARAEDSVAPRTFSQYWTDRLDRGRSWGRRRVQSYDPEPGYRDQQPRYPNSVTRRWIPGHLVGGYLRGGVWVPERWEPGRMVEVLEVD